jgi:hypothetical protein
MPLTRASLAFVVAFSLAGSFVGVLPAAAQGTSADAAPTPAIASAISPATASAASLTFDDQQRPYRRGATSSTTGARVFGLVDVERMKASQSFTTILGTQTLIGFGAGADITGLGGGLFVRLALSDMSKTGTRSDGSQFANGIAVNVKMIPIDLAAGWRFEHLSPRQTITPYIGGGALLLRYSETTPSGTTDDNVSSFFFGYEAFGGVDVRLSRVLTIAPEVDYRAVPNAIGKGGVSADFNETDLGGIAFRITVGARFGGSR